MKSYSCINNCCFALVSRNLNFEAKNRPCGNFCLAASNWIYWPSGLLRHIFGWPVWAIKEYIWVARLHNEVGTKYFFRGTNFLTKNAPIISPKCCSLYLVGPKIPQIPAKFPATFPSQNQKITDELLQERREKNMNYCYRL